MTPGPGVARTPLPKGFHAGGVNCGVRKYRPDLGLITSDLPATAAGVTTQNTARAACVDWCRERLPSAGIRAIVTNSGQANAATGTLGVENNARMAHATAAAVGCGADQVLTASTGMIGVHLAIEQIEAALPELARERLTDMAETFAVAILTTDLVPKTVTTTAQLSGGLVTITGIAKGSGMIHPNMATMLGYVLTDATLSPADAQKMLREATDVSFNMVSVDGDTSTNDCNFLLANGASGVACSTPEDLAKLQEAVTAVCQFLAKSIARDGEGATKLLEVEVSRAPELDTARRAARGLTLSPLFKCAIHGEDPNWGRVLARLGAEGVPGEWLSRMDLRIQGTTVFADGAPRPFERDAVRGLLRADTVRIEVDFKLGDLNATAWGCDFSRKYVEINAEYTT